MSGSEVERRADFSAVRYAQCWEDADALRAGLRTEPGDRCLSIASAGDNALALLLDDPASVLAVDLSPAQLACCALRIGMLRTLEHADCLRLLGSRPAEPGLRRELYRRCRRVLDEDTRRFWDAADAADPERGAVAAGVAGCGRFESYFAAFRRWALPLVHPRRRVEALLEPRDPAARRRFFEESWNTRRWRALFRGFFSNFVMARLGRDPAFFRYVDGGVAGFLLGRTEHALAGLDPSANPYLRWVLTGTHGDALPAAWRPEHFDAIRRRVDRVQLRRCPLEAALGEAPAGSLHRFNASDVFEYMSRAASDALFGQIARACAPGGAVVYWNMAVPRQSPAGSGLTRDPAEEARLQAEDKAWFYRRIGVERKAR